MTTATEWSTWATFGATAVTAAATGVLAWFTWLMARETARANDRASTPQVVATLEPCPRSITLVNILVSNTGTAPAFDVEVKTNPPLPSLDSGSPREVPLQNISVLRPNQRMESLLAEYEQLAGQRFEVRTSWARKPSGRREELNYTIDIDQFDGMSPEPFALNELAHELKQLREDWQWISRGSRRLVVDVHTERDRLHQQRIRARFRRRRQRERQTKG